MSLGAEARDSIVEQKMGSTILVRPRAETIGSQHREGKVVLVENMGRCERDPTSIWQRNEVRLKEKQISSSIATSFVLWYPCSISTPRRICSCRNGQNDRLKHGNLSAVDV